MNTQILDDKDICFNLPLIKISIVDTELIFLVDSGSQISLLNYDAFRRIKIKNLDVQRADITVRSISGNILNTTHFAILPVTIDNRQYFHKFYIINSHLSDHYNAILGYDFLHKFKFTLSLDTNSLTTGNVSMKLDNVLNHDVIQQMPSQDQIVTNIVTQHFDNRDIDKIKSIRRQSLRESDFDLSHLQPEVKSRLLKLLFEFSDIFSKDLYTIGRTDAVKPKLQVDFDQLPSSRPYKIAKILEIELKRQLEEMLDANIIEKSDSHVSFPLIMVKKKNPTSDPNKQKWRLVVDYRRLNKHLKYPRHKLPLINQQLENLNEGSLFTTLDLSSSFHQIALHPLYRNLTTFVTPFGQFRFVCLSQGLSCSPEIFCDLADKILAPLSDLKFSNYIDDFACSADTVSEMLFKLRKLFERFREFNLTLNPEKCTFMKPEIKFLGHELSKEGIKPLEDNLKKIADFPVPTTVKKVRRFHGLISYYRKYIEHFSELAIPLTNLSKKNQKFLWTPSAQKSFEILKQKLISSPILISPDFKKEFILSCDAGKYALGGMLGQKDENGIIRPIAYFSKKLNPTQIRYSIFDKELMAIVKNIETFKYYLYGRKFTIRCDNAALTKLDNLQSISDRVARWLSFLADYHYEFDLIKTHENTVADILSRDFYVNRVTARKDSSDSQKSCENFIDVNNHNDFSSNSCNATYFVNNDFEKLCEDSSYKSNNLDNYSHDSFTKSNYGSDLNENCEINNFVYKNSSVHFYDSHKTVKDEIRKGHDLTRNVNSINTELLNSYNSQTNIHNMTKNSSDAACEYASDDINFYDTEYQQKESCIIKNTIVGLENLGSTCYLNSVLQCLTNCLPLREFLLNDKLSLSCCDSLNFCMICVLRRHIINVMNNSGEVITPIEIYTNLRSIAPHFTYDHQQDAHEFLNYVLDSMWKSIPLHYSNSNKKCENKFEVPLNSIFCSYVKTEIKCLECKNRSFTYNKMMDFILDITQNVKTLDSALYNFIQPEILPNEYSCQCSKNKVNAKIENSISKLPMVITFQLKRFSFKNSQSMKVHNSVTYPEILNLRPFLEVTNGKPICYSLTGVIVHSGSSSQMGHYYTYVKDSTGTWFLLDDSRIIKVSLEEVLNQKAYILFYTKMEHSKTNTNNTSLTDISNMEIKLDDEEKEFLFKEFGVNAIQIDLPTINEIILAQKSDPKTAKIISEIAINPHTAKVKYPNYLMENGLLMHSAFIPRVRKSKNVLRIVIPLKFQNVILASNHISHFGVLRTYNLIREKYFWEHLYADTKHFVQSCYQCNSFKTPHIQKPVPIQRNFIPNRPMQFLSTDHLGPFTQTNKGNKYILTFIDHFTKYIRLYAVPDVTAQTTAEKFLDFISLFGICEKLLSDKGPAFTADLFRSLCIKFGVVKLFTTPMNPKCNGGSESLNRNIKKSLSIFADNTTNWDDYLNYYSLIYNSTIHGTTNEKPSFLHLGYDPLLPTDILNERIGVEHRPLTNFVEEKTAQLQYANKIVAENIYKAALVQEEFQHRHAKYRDFQIGQLVYLLAPGHDRFTKILKARNYTGPFRVTRRHNKVDYSIIDERNSNAREFKINAYRLIPYITRKEEFKLFKSDDQKINEPILPSTDDSPYINKPYATFDESIASDFILPLFQNAFSDIKGNEHLNVNNTPLSRDTPATESPVHSHISEDTIIYSPVAQTSEDREENFPLSTQAGKPVLQAKTEGLDSIRQNYELRQRDPINYYAEKVFNMALELTK